jgi:hypothetical protein
MKTLLYICTQFAKEAGFALGIAVESPQGRCSDSETVTRTWNEKPDPWETPKKFELNEDEEHTKFLHYCSH